MKRSKEQLPNILYQLWDIRDGLRSPGTTDCATDELDILIEELETETGMDYNVEVEKRNGALDEV